MDAGTMNVVVVYAMEIYNTRTEKWYHVKKGTVLTVYQNVRFPDAMYAAKIQGDWYRVPFHNVRHV